ncbi:MAG: outer membrane beta-barrel protein [Bacteroidota bacterium]|nr:outer membrane beta-barrel protein [Bacteroidota bacterium]
MKRVILTFIFIILLISSRAQVFESGFRLGIYFQPDYSYKTDVVKSVNNPGQDKPKFGYQTGLQFTNFITTDIFIGTGISFVNRGFCSTFSENDRVLYKTPELSLRYYPALINNQIPAKRTFYYSFYFLEIPLIFGYKLKVSRNIDFTFKTGVATDYFLHGTTKIEDCYKDKTTRYPAKFNFKNNSELNYSLFLGSDMNYNFYKRFTLFAQPQYDLMLKPIFLENNYRTYNFRILSLGIKIGIKVRFL